MTVTEQVSVFMSVGRWQQRVARRATATTTTTATTVKVATKGFFSGDASKQLSNDMLRARQRHQTSTLGAGDNSETRAQYPVSVLCSFLLEVVVPAFMGSSRPNTRLWGCVYASCTL